MAQVSEHDISEYTPDPANANAGTERGVYMLDTSLENFGAGRSALADRDGVLIAGNKTVERAAEHGIRKVIEIETDGTELVIVRRRDLSLAEDPEHKARGLAYADNRTGEIGLAWDAGQLLDDINAGIDLGAFWKPEELEDLLSSVREEPPADPGAAMDRAAELQEKWQTARGQIWQVGRHRVMCGDSTSAEDVAALMVGAKADMVFTSPPYNVDVQYASHDDSHKDVDEYLDWLRGICFVWIETMADGRAFIWNIGVSARTYPHHHVIMLEQLGLNFERQYVWAKVGVPVPAWYHTTIRRRARYVTSNYTHEMVYVFGKGELIEGDAITPIDTLEHDVIRINQTLATRDIPEGISRSGAGKSINLERRALKAHPAAFPVDLPSAFMGMYAAAGEIVVDPFLGSGTTAVAAEQLGRVCYGMEISPAYVAVSLERLSGMGLEPRIVENASA